MKFYIKKRTRDSLFDDWEGDEEFKEVSLKEKLYDIWQYKLYYPFHWYIINPYNTYLYGLISRLGVIIAYIPILWMDKDWDHHFILRLLKFKLKRTLKCAEEDQLHDNKRNIRDIKICIHLLERLIEDDYELKASQHLDKKFGKLKFYKLQSGNFTLKRIKGIDELKYRRVLKRVYKEADKIKKHDSELLFKIFHKKMNRWWW